MAHVIVLDSNNQVIEPSVVLRKRPLLVMRSSFSNLERFAPHIFEAGFRQLCAEGISFEREPASLLELTTHPANRVENLVPSEMLRAVERLSNHTPVIVSDYPETYLLSRYLQRHSLEPVRFLLSVAAAAKTMHEAFYQGLPGTLLEGIGRLLSTNVKLYVYPMPTQSFHAALKDLSGELKVRDPDGKVVTLDDLLPPAPNLHLFNYLRDSGRLMPLKVDAL